MDPASVRSVLAGVGLEPRRVRAIEGGWAYWTFDLDCRWIVRFPRNTEIAVATDRELALLPELSAFLPFAIPVPSHRGEWACMPFFVYPRIHGEALGVSQARPQTYRAIGEMLACLHSFPAERASQLLGLGPPEGAWRRRFEELWPVVEAHALPAMPKGLARALENEFHRFVAELDDLPYCLVHNDLGPAHILVDTSTGQPSGIIDFESAWVGDPVVDFVPLWDRTPPELRGALLGDRDLGDRVAERMWFYRWMGSVHAIIYGVTAGDDQELQGGLTELSRRLHTKS